MGLSQPHVQGRTKRFYVVREATSGTFVRPSAVSAVKTMRSNIEPTLERINRRDSSQTGSTTQRITGRVGVSWSADTYVVPSGTAGTPPDCHDLLLNYFGTYANVASTSDTYTIADSQTARGSLSITEEENAVCMKAAVMAWTEQIKISYTGTSLPMIGFEGGAADFLYTGYSLLDGAVIDTATQIVVEDADQYEVGSVISIGSSNNSGGSPPGHIVTAKSGATLTVSPAISGAQSDAVVVAPYVPTETTAGAVLSYTLATATLTGHMTTGSSTTLPVVSFEIVGKNNYEVHDDEAGSQIVTDITPGWRDTTGTITFRARRDQMIRFGHWWNSPSTTRALVVTIGSTAGSRMVVSVPYLEVENPNIEIPEAETGTITLPFYALGSSGADEWSVAFT